MSEIHSTELDPLYYKHRGFTDRSQALARSVASNPFGAFLAGLGVGFAAAVLFAPKSGTELRAQISDSARSARDKIKQQTSRVIPDEVRDKVRDKVEAFRSRGSRTRERQRAESQTSLGGERGVADVS